MENQVEESIKIERRNQIMDIQQRVSYQLNKNHIGEVMKGIVVGRNRNFYIVRSYFNAPDDIDGNIYVKSNEKYNVGDEITFKVTSCSIYDLEGETL